VVVEEEEEDEEEEEQQQVEEEEQQQVEEEEEGQRKVVVEEEMPEAGRQPPATHLAEDVPTLLPSETRRCDKAVGFSARTYIPKQ